MKILKKNLVENLAAVSEIASRRQSLPILNCVLVHASGGRLSLCATDLDQRLTLAAECDGELGAVCIPSSKLRQLAESSGESIELKLDGGRLTFKSGFSATLSVLSAEEFPKEQSHSQTKHGVNCADLAKGIKSVVWCASADPVRHVLNSVRVKLEPKRITCESADGANLARYRLSAIASPCDIIIPSSMASRVAWSLEQDGAVFSCGDNSARIEFANGSYQFKLVEGKFPDYNPNDFSKRRKIGELLPSAIIPAIKNCLFLCPDRKTPSMAMEFSKSAVWIGSTFKGDDVFECDIPGDFIPKKLHLNAKSTERCLSAFNGSKISLSTLPETEAVIFEAGDLTVFSMPLRGE